MALVYVPAERSIQDSNRNLNGVSGEINRILAVRETYKNLIPVMVPVNRIEGVAFAKKRDISLKKGWESLRPYKIGVRIGTKFAEKIPKECRSVKARPISHCFPCSIVTEFRSV